MHIIIVEKNGKEKLYPMHFKALEARKSIFIFH